MASTAIGGDIFILHPFNLESCSISVAYTSVPGTSKTNFGAIASHLALLKQGAVIALFPVSRVTFPVISGMIKIGVLWKR